MSTNTAPDAELLQPGDTIHFYETIGVQRDSLLFSPPILTQHGMELVLTAEILAAYEYPEKDSWLTRLGEPDRNGKVIARRGPWPSEELSTKPGTYERELEREAALKVIWEEYGEHHSAAKAQAIKELNAKYGEAVDPASRFRIYYPNPDDAEVRLGARH